MSCMGKYCSQIFWFSGGEQRVLEKVEAHTLSYFYPKSSGTAALRSCLMSPADNWLDKSLMKAQIKEKSPADAHTQVKRKRHSVQIIKMHTGAIRACCKKENGTRQRSWRLTHNV